MTKSSEEVGYATGRATKADIVEAAFHVFAESGYGGTSVREIARRAGINHATLLHHFPHKWLLLQSVLELRDELQHIEPNSLDETLALLLGIAVRNDETPGLTRLFTLLAAESADPDHPARTYFRDRLARLRHQISYHIEQAQASGQVAPEVDPEGVATDIVALWEGLQLQAPLSAETVSVSGRLATMFAALAGHPIEPIFLGE
ncbi:MAG TPA: TetR/AcrR family transcriptional regulator [Propionibacteriaceae bacterium]|nr:TetR/AcrR family transcriptional regulator [Propionibacteriaceae bacterium]